MVAMTGIIGLLVCIVVGVVTYRIGREVGAAETYRAPSRDGVSAPVLEVVRAIRIQGPAPSHHQAVMRKHRSEWPTLWRALDRLLEEVDR